MALTCTYNSESTGQTFLVSITGGPSGDMCIVDGSGPTIKREGKSRTLFNLVQAASCEFTIHVNNSATRAFVAQYIASTDTLAFYVQVFGASGIEFGGVIIPAQVSVVEQSWRNYDFKIKAIDGISLLKDIQYAHPNGDPFINSVDPDSILDHLGNIMNLLPTKSVHQGVYIQTDWASQYSSDLDEHDVNHRVFQKESETTGAGIVAYTAWEVLHQFLKVFHWNLVYVSGHYFFQNLLLQSSGAASITRYDMDLNPSGGGLPLSTFAISIRGCGGNLPALLEVGYNTFAGGLKESEIRYEHKGFLGNFGWRDTKYNVLADGPADCKTDLGLVPVPDAETRLRISGTLEWVVKGTVSQTEFEFLGIRALFYITIQIGTSFYKREFVGNRPEFYDFEFTEEEWDTGGTYLIYDARKGHQIQADKKFSLPFEIETDYIPEALDQDQLSICLQMEAIREDGTTAVGNPVSITEIQGFWHDQHIQVISGQEANKIEDEAITITILGKDTNSEKESHTIYFGDGPTKSTESAIKYNVDGSPTTEWTSSTVSVSSIPIQELSARSRMALGENKVRFLEGTICGFDFPLLPIIYEGSRFVPIITSYNTRKGEITGEWASITAGGGVGPGGPMIAGVPDVAFAPIGSQGPIIDVTEGLQGDKVTLVNEHETARSPRPPNEYDGSGQYMYKMIPGPFTSYDLTTFTDLVLPIYLPAQWHVDLYDAMVKVFRNGVLQERRSSADPRIYGYEISSDGTTITPHEELTAGDYLQIFVWRYI